MMWMLQRHCMIEVAIGSQKRSSKTLRCGKHRFIIVSRVTGGIKQNHIMSARDNQFRNMAREIFIKQKSHNATVCSG